MSLFHTILTFLAAADLFLWWRSARLLGRSIPLTARIALHGFFLLQIGAAALLFCAPLTPIALHLFHAIPLFFIFLIYLWHIVLVPVALVCHLLGISIATLAEAFYRIRRWLRPQPAVAITDEKGEEPGTPPALSRREFLGTLAALAPPLLTFPLGAYAKTQSDDFLVRRLEIPVPGLPPALDGMTIAHLSDLHIGQFTNGPLLGRIVEAVNALQADLTVFTGDLINSDIGMLPEAFALLRALRPAPILCEGNHDVGGSRAAFEQCVKGAGINLLVDESTLYLVRGIPVQLLGLRWEGPANWQNRHNEAPLASSVHHLLRQRIPGAFPILLAHHPHAWDYSGDIPLTLSGHTHGGQLMLDAQHGFGPLLFRYWTGVYQRDYQTLVVSNGLGNWFPLRANAPAELLHLTLRAPKS